MNVVYVVTSAGRDRYSALTRVSAASLRLANPGARATVVCDAETDRALRASDDPLVREVADRRVFETPAGAGVFRNRFLKTSLRERIEGDYLFLDSDTIVRDDLAPIFRMPGDVAAAPNHSRDEVAAQISGIDRQALDRMGWSPDPRVYVNGGALRVADSEAARRFHRLWHEKWLDAQRQLGDYRDQPALNSALRDARAECAILPHRCNAQITHAPETAPDAAIWHYYSAQRRAGFNNLDGFVQQVQATGRIDLHALQRLMRTPVKWRRHFWGSEHGENAVRWASRDLVRAYRNGRETGESRLKRLLDADPAYARKALAKALADSFWGGLPDGFRAIRRALLLRFPQEALRTPVRQCLIHAMRRPGVPPAR